MPPPMGRVILGDFLVGIAQDTTALWITYAGRDQRHANRPVRVTVLRRDALTEAGMASLPDGWHSMLASLRHPALPPCLASGLVEGSFHVVTDGVGGETLETRIARAPGRRLTVAETAEIVARTAEPLAWLHTRPAVIIHEALDPRALHVASTSLDVHLSNAGLVHAMRQAGLSRLVAPISYSAPEQLENQPIGPGADQFVLASLAFECITGTRAYADDEASAQAMLSGFRPQLPEDVGDRRPGLTRTLHRAWSRHPEVRFPSVSAFAAEFARSAGVDVVVPPQESFSPARSVTLVGLSIPAPPPAVAPQRPAQPPAMPVHPPARAPAMPAASPSPMAHQQPPAPNAPLSTLQQPVPLASTTPYHQPPVPLASPTPYQQAPVPLASPTPYQQPPLPLASPTPYQQPPRLVATPVASTAFAQQPRSAPGPRIAAGPRRAPQIVAVGVLVALFGVGGALWLRVWRQRTAGSSPPIGGPAAGAVNASPVPAVAPPRPTPLAAPIAAPLPAAQTHAVAPLPVAQTPPVAAVPVAQTPPVAPVPVAQTPPIAAVPVAQTPPVAPVPVAQTPSVVPMPVAQTPPVAPAPPIAHATSQDRTTVAEIRESLQRGVNDCAARTRRYGRHIFVGIGYERPGGEPVAIRVAGAPILESMRSCIEEVARTTHSPQTGLGRWQYSFYLRIP